jgi:signal transduction histidine kinase
MVLASAARGFFDELTQRLSRDIAMYVVREAELLRDGKLVASELARVAHDAMVVNPLAEVYVLDTSGRILGHGSADALPLQAVALEPVREFLSANAAYPIYGTDPRSPNGTRVFSAWEIRSGEQLQGYAYVLLAGAASRSAHATIVESHMLRAAAGTLAVFVLLAIIAAIALSRYITQPLSQLHRRVLELGASYGTESLPRKTARNGIADVSAAVETLAARLSDQVKRLEQVDAARRELFVNLSHDLRTPLTAMQCALEALGDAPRSITPEAHRRWVEIALRHCERLNRLVGQIFSLARLSSSSLPIRRERVRLTELAQDVVSQFQHMAVAAKVQLQLRVDPEAPPTLADIGALETVLQNLLDNALRHTPSGGVVDVTVERHEDSVEVSVCDNGSGIPATDLERVLEPFQCGAGGRTGLGLAIVRKALALHDSRLVIASAPRRGTEVRFRLPGTGTQPSVDETRHRGGALARAARG